MLQAFKRYTQSCFKVIQNVDFAIHVPLAMRYRNLFRPYVLIQRTEVLTDPFSRMLRKLVCSNHSRVTWHALLACMLAALASGRVSLDS